MFRIFKFRTMYADAVRRFVHLVLLNPSLGEEFEKHGKLNRRPAGDACWPVATKAQSG